MFICWFVLFSKCHYKINSESVWKQESIDGVTFQLAAALRFCPTWIDMRFHSTSAIAGSPFIAWWHFTHFTNSVVLPSTLTHINCFQTSLNTFPPLDSNVTLSLFKSINFCISFFSIMLLHSYGHSITRAQNEQQTPGRAQILGVLGPRIWARPGVCRLTCGTPSAITSHSEMLSVSSSCQQPHRQTAHCDVTVAESKRCHDTVSRLV